MKFLTIEYIKQHSRIDYDCEDAELELYGSSAENTLLALIRRTIDNVKDLNGGKVPAEYYHAALMLADAGYQHRSPASPQNYSMVPYGNVDILIKKEMRLTDGSDLQAERDTLLDLLDEVVADFDFDYSRKADPTDELTEAYTAEREKLSTLRETYAAIPSPTAKMCAALRGELTTARTACERILKDNQ